MESTPEFTNEFFKPILENHFRQMIHISNVKVEDMTNSALNFCSKLRRITVAYHFEKKQENHEIALVAKCLPDNEFMAQFVTDMGMFDCEIETYSTVIPKLLMLNYREKFAPSVYYTSREPKPIIILEDLSSLNYRVLDKRVGLDLEHSLLAVEKLAYYHAATAALHMLDSSILPKFHHSPFRRTDRLHDIMSASYEEVVNVCRNWPELGDYVEKLNRAKPHILLNIYDLQNLKVNFSVLNRGDFWTANILFSYGPDGNLTNVAFVDVQHSTFTSPCFDLHFFLATSLMEEIKCEKVSIVNRYFETFVMNLRKLRVKIVPTRAEFDEDFRIMGYCGFAASIYGLPFMKASRTEGASPENFLADGSKDSFRHHCFNNEVYLKELFHFLPFYNSLGLFDVRD
uniref:CHK kinase-like domain-containing protein n=1 Tax=Photinus pyralis TaxID=7054 RepID=A0A1Y1JZL2_PHOPY